MLSIESLVNGVGHEFRLRLTPQIRPESSHPMQKRGSNGKRCQALGKVRRDTVLKARRPWQTDSRRLWGQGNEGWNRPSNPQIQIDTASTLEEHREARSSQLQ